VRDSSGRRRRRALQASRTWRAGNTRLAWRAALADDAAEVDATAVGEHDDQVAAAVHDDVVDPDALAADD